MVLCPGILGVFLSAPNGSASAEKEKKGQQITWTGVFRIEQPQTVTSVAFAPDGKHLLVTTTDVRKNVIVIDAISGREKFAISREPLFKDKGLRDYCTCAAYSPDNKWIALGSFTRHVVILCDATDGKDKLTLQEADHKDFDSVRSVAFRQQTISLGWHHRDRW